MAVAAVAAVLRWTVMANTADVAALALMEPLHGLTFAPQSSTMEILAALPLLVAYPLMRALRLRRLDGRDETGGSAAGGFAGDTHIA